MNLPEKMDPPYPKEENRPYPPAYSELPPQGSTFPPLPSGGKPHLPIVDPAVPPVHPPYPTPGVPPVSSSIPQVYPPYPPTDVPPVTSPPGVGVHPVQPPTSGITTVQVIEAPTRFGPESQYVRCPNCGVQSFTTTESKATTTTHLIALLLCCFILWPIAWLPYVCNSCQSTVHYCSNCNHYLGERSI